MAAGRSRARTVGAHLALTFAIVAGGTVIVTLLFLVAMVLAPVGAALVTYAIWRSATAARRRVPHLRLVREDGTLPAPLRGALRIRSL